MPQWGELSHFSPRVAAPVVIPTELAIPHKAARTMGRVAQLATISAGLAMRDAGLSDEEVTSGNVGLAYGSTHGSSQANEDWVRKLVANKGFLGMTATTYLKFMSNTTAANLATHFGIRGRVMCTSAACVSASSGDRLWLRDDRNRALRRHGVRRRRGASLQPCRGVRHAVCREQSVQRRRPSSRRAHSTRGATAS